MALVMLKLGAQQRNGFPNKQLYIRPSSALCLNWTSMLQCVHLHDPPSPRFRKRRWPSFAGRAPLPRIFDSGGGLRLSENEL